MWLALSRNAQGDQCAGASEARMLDGHPDRGSQRGGLSQALDGVRRGWAEWSELSGPGRGGSKAEILRQARA